MCICGGFEVAAAAAIGGYVMKKTFKLKLPPLAEVVAGMRAGVRPGQVFKDKRRAARVNARASTRREIDATDNR